jgi:ubiquinone/menaquinone biosynthesis C-methylase UbiE
MSPDAEKKSGFLMAYPVKVFDGARLKFKDKSFDVVLFNAVLHHAARNTIQLMKDACRIARKRVILIEDIGL